MSEANAVSKATQLSAGMRKHKRVPWGIDPKTIWINARLDQIKGTFRRSEREAAPFVQRYDRAKKLFDHVAAADIVEEFVSDVVIDAVVDVLLGVNKPALVVMPHPEWDSGEQPDPSADIPTNAIPFALARYLAVELGCEVDNDILEVARPGRTKLTSFARFLWQPRFEGAIRQDRAYILVDDVCTLGGTFAMLRSHIVEQGGTVIAVSALASTAGIHQKFPVTGSTLDSLHECYGSALDDFLIGEVGHGPVCLTEAEGRVLLEWGNERVTSGGRDVERSFQRLRGRFAKAAATAR